MKTLVQIMAPSQPAWSVWACQGNHGPACLITKRVHVWPIVEEVVGSGTRETALVGLGVDELGIYDGREGNFLGYAETDPTTWDEETKQRWQEEAKSYRATLADSARSVLMDKLG